LGTEHLHSGDEHQPANRTTSLRSLVLFGRICFEYGAGKVFRRFLNRIKEVQMEKEKVFYERLASKGVSRRDFMKFCTFLTATMGLSSSFVPKVAEVFAAPKQRPPVIWLHFGECTGCSEALLRSMYPWIDELVLEILSVEYHETIMAAAGHQAEENLHNAVEKYAGQFICVVEGAVATKFNGGYGKVAGKSFLQIARKWCPRLPPPSVSDPARVLAVSLPPNPTPAATRASARRSGIKTLNLPGCPPNPINLSAPLSTTSSLANSPPWMKGTPRICLRQNHP
jgi:[NiFe] hydrogenase small subunit